MIALCAVALVAAAVPIQSATKSLPQVARGHCMARILGSTAAPASLAEPAVGDGDYSPQDDDILTWAQARRISSAAPSVSSSPSTSPKGTKRAREASLPAFGSPLRQRPQKTAIR